VRRGTLTTVDQEEGIVAVEVPAGTRRVVRPRPAAKAAQAPGVWAVAGPDRAGEIAFIALSFPVERHALKMVQRDGSGERAVFERAGDPLWKQAAGQSLALARDGRRVALVGQMHGVQMEGALLQEGPLEIWDVERRTHVSKRQVLDEGLAWFADGRRVACVVMMETGAAPAAGSGEDGFGGLWKSWKRVPVVCVMEVETGELRPLGMGVRPVISAGEEAVVYSDLPDARGMHCRKVGLGKDAGPPVAMPGRIYVAYAGAGDGYYLDAPGAGESVEMTRYFSPLRGSQPLLVLRREGGKADGRALLGGFDARNPVSFSWRR
jgi:hypothetical protein